MRQSVAPNRQPTPALMLRRALSEVGLCEARVDELLIGRRMAVELIGPQIAAAASLVAIVEKSGCGSYVVREGGRVAGFMSIVLLNRAGMRAVQHDSFDPVTPDLAHVIWRDEEPAAIYGWGVAASNREAARAVVSACATTIETIPCPYFGRAATEAGRRLLTGKLGFSAYPGSRSGLLWRRPPHDMRRVA